MDSHPRSRFSTVLLAVSVLALLLVCPTNASATHVSCGDTITQDTTLDNDLIDCPGDGVVIGADNITLDLNGHTIDGDGHQSPPCSTAVANGRPAFWCAAPRTGHDHVTIKNGVIKEFNFGGVWLDHARDNTVRRLTILDTDFSVILDYADDNRIEANAMSGRGGVLFDIGSHRNRIERNSIADVPGFGIFLELGSDQNEIVRNELSHNSLGGIAADTDGNLIARNSVSFSGDVGIDVIGRDNRVERNNVSFTAGAEPRGAGIWLASSEGTLVSRNVSNDNEDDGIRVLSPGVTLTANTTNRNGDLGIQAIPGVIDGGQNRAFGNRNPLQCLNVQCK